MHTTAAMREYSMSLSESMLAWLVSMQLTVRAMAVVMTALKVTLVVSSKVATPLLKTMMQRVSS